MVLPASPLRAAPSSARPAARSRDLRAGEARLQAYKAASSCCDLRQAQSLRCLFDRSRDAARIGENKITDRNEVGPGPCKWRDFVGTRRIGDTRRLEHFRPPRNT